MAEPISVELNGFWQQYIADKVASGAYQSAEELITSALCLLEEQEGGVDQLTALLEEAEREGGFEPWDLQKFLLEVRGNSDDRKAA